LNSGEDETKTDVSVGGLDEERKGRKGQLEVVSSKAKEGGVQDASVGSPVRTKGPDHDTRGSP